jgi:hypothetical protein
VADCDELPAGALAAAIAGEQGARACGGRGRVAASLRGEPGASRPGLKLGCLSPSLTLAPVNLLNPLQAWAAPRCWTGCGWRAAA